MSPIGHRRRLPDCAHDEAPIAGRCDERFARRSATRSRRTSPSRARSAPRSACSSTVSRSSTSSGASRTGPRTAPWAPDTIVDFYSVGKALVALSLLRLVDAGRHRPRRSDRLGVARVRGRRQGDARRCGTRSRHRAGVPAIREPLTDDDLWSWTRMTEAIAATEAWWVPGTRHSVSHQHLRLPRR